MARRERRKFSDEYMAEAVGLVRSSGTSILEIRRDLEGTWLKIDDMGAQAGWLDRGQRLLAQGAWTAARNVFADALVDVVGAADEAAAAEGLGQAAWELDDGNEVIAARERAYRGYRSAGDGLGAARMATWLGLDAIHFRGEPAVAQGWFGRAHRLLAREPEAVEHALLALFEGQVALRVDQDGARDQSRRRRRGCWSAPGFR